MVFYSRYDSMSSISVFLFICGWCQLVIWFPLFSISDRPRRYGTHDGWHLYWIRHEVQVCFWSKGAFLKYRCIICLFLDYCFIFWVWWILFSTFLCCHNSGSWKSTPAARRASRPSRASSPTWTTLNILSTRRSWTRKNSGRLSISSHQRRRVWLHLQNVRRKQRWSDQHRKGAEVFKEWLKQMIIWVRSVRFDIIHSYLASKSKTMESHLKSSTVILCED